jgi:peptidylprolyl isomerase
MKKVVEGIQNSINGKDSPLSETVCIQSVTQIQEEAHKVLANENLAKAESFLKKNAKDTSIISLEPGKVQYKVVEEGKGTEVEKHFSPLITYVGKFIDGKVFGESTGDEVISLSETIPGFSQAIVGMREGEKRLIYVHPERGYGSNAGYLPPNSLLCFEVTVKQANAEKKDDQTLSTAPKEEQQEVFTK